MAKISTLKKLSPEERIKKLKEIREKNLKEIEEAEKIIEESIKEIKIKQDIREIPMPSLEEINIQSLFTAGSLEQKVDEESPQPPKKEEEDFQAAYHTMASEFSRQPTGYVAQAMENLYNTVVETGYVTPGQAAEARAAYAVARQRERQISRGAYENISRQVAGQIVLAKNISKSIMEFYMQ